MKSILAGAVLILFSSMANAQFIQGNQLKEWMAAYDRLEKGGKNSLDFDHSSSVISYVTGVAETFSNMGMICLPHGVTAGQMVAVVGRYLDENPDKWNQQANGLTFVALSRAFPCKK